MNELAGLNSELPAIPKPTMEEEHVTLQQTTNESRLHCFLLLGNCDRIYRCGDEQENFQPTDVSFIDRLIHGGRGPDVVEKIRKLSDQGRVVKQNCILYALARCVSCNCPATRREALRAIPDVCRIPTYLFLFLEYCKQMKAKQWGRAKRNAIANLYNYYPNGPMNLALHVTKYPKRGKWRHIDVLRLAHVTGNDLATQYILRYIVKGIQSANELLELSQQDVTQDIQQIRQFLDAVERAKKCTSRNEDELIRLIREHKLLHDHIPKARQTNNVWAALIPHMPPHALIRNLRNFSLRQILHDNLETITTTLRDTQRLRRERVHPFEILMAYYELQPGRPETLLSVLQQSFLSLVDDPTGNYPDVSELRFLIGIDCSIPGDKHVSGITMTTRQAITGLVMELVHSVTHHSAVHFATGKISHEFTIRHNENIADVAESLFDNKTHDSDLSRPFEYAAAHNHDVDIFVLFTTKKDNSGHGKTPLGDALTKYRRQSSRPDAKLVVVDVIGKVHTYSSLPDDERGLLYVEGVDARVVQIIKDFAVL